MDKIFDFDTRNRSLIDNVSGVVPVNTNCSLKRTEKGFAVDSPGGVNSSLAFGDVCKVGEDDFTVYIIVKACPQATYPSIIQTTLANPDWNFGFTNSGKMYIYLRNSSGTLWGYWPVSIKLDGHYHLLSATINRGGLLTVYWDNVLDGMIDISGLAGTLDHPGTTVRVFHLGNQTKANVTLIRFVKGVASPQERANVYQEFLHSSPTSTPIVIRHKIPVRADESKLSDPLFDDILADPWATKINATWIGGETIFDSTGGGSVTISNTGMGLDDGKDYEFTYTVVSNAGGSIQFMISSSSFTGLTVQLSRDVGTHTYQISSNGSSDFLRLLMNSGNGTITIKDIKLKRFLSPVLVHDYQNWRGGIIPDLSGNGLDGTPNGFVDVGRDDAKFPGVIGNYINCGNGGGITGNLTIETLVKGSSFGGSGGMINKGTSALLAINYYLGFNFDELRCIISDGVTSQDIITTTLNALVNEWYYIVLTVDGSFVTSYANGQEVLQTVQTVTPTNNANPLHIGGLDATNFPLPGSIKFIKVLPYALTEDQIKAKWNEIARLVGLHVMDKNLLPDGRVYTAGQVITL